MASRSLHVPLMLALTFSTGIGDAVGYLHLDRVFTGNMTGNVVILGMALAGADDLPVLGPLLALGGFMLGAAIGGLVLRGMPAGWFGRTSVLFGVVAAVLASQAVVLALVPSPGDGPAGPAIATTLAAAMGLQAATARHLSVKDVTTVVVTSTITALAADSFSGHSGGVLNRRLVAILAICAGAAVGALLLRWNAGAAIGLAALLTAGVAVVGHRTIEVHPTEATQEAR